jgi:tRNA(Leu) C34 or U34 (ribose-2'-O)-methylase TrmL
LVESVHGPVANLAGWFHRGLWLHDGYDYNITPHDLDDSMVESAIYGKGKRVGETPAVVLINPKNSYNVGGAQRACSCWGVHQLWWTGDRVRLEPKEPGKKAARLPREERMKGYMDVTLRQFDYPFEQFEKATIVAIELVPGAEPLPTFEHPENAVYVFGPEDGSIDSVTRRHCHRFISIPAYHCTNLALAVGLVLYDRFIKQNKDVRLDDILKERRYLFADHREISEELGLV